MAGLCASCQRFAVTLTNSGPMLDRYPFNAVDLHHPLLADLPAHAKLFRSTSITGSQRRSRSLLGRAQKRL